MVVELVWLLTRRIRETGEGVRKPGEDPMAE
jgi:hypothetical protein